MEANRAAVIIQTYWRCYKANKEYNKQVMEISGSTIFNVQFSESKVYSFKDEVKDVDGCDLIETIRYGEIMHSTILEIFGHLMYYDDLKFYARDRDASTYLTAEFRWRNDDCNFTVFKDTDSTDSFSTDGFYHGQFNRYSMSMEPFITLGQIESELENAEDEERSP